MKTLLACRSPLSMTVNALFHLVQQTAGAQSMLSVTLHNYLGFCTFALGDGPTSQGDSSFSKPQQFKLSCLLLQSFPLHSG